MLNQRGQEFSVFKLLISAIVAIVILTLLLNVLGIINFNPNTDPAKAAENLLGDMDNSIYQEKISTRVDFSKESSINTASLEEKIGLSREQICLSVSEDLPPGFTATGGKIISYAGSSSVRVKLVGICANKEDFSDQSYLDYAPLLASKTYADTSCAFPDGQKACLLVLIKSDE